MNDSQKFIKLHNSLMTLSHQKDFIDYPLHKKIQSITKSCAEHLKVARASIWALNDTRDKISCKVLYSRDRDVFEECDDLSEQDFPSYFKAIKTDRLIDASNTFTDPRTCEFSDVYLRPLNIHALLDAPIFAVGKLYGVLCLEQTGEPRVWDVAEMSYVAAAADTVSLANEHELWLKALEESALYERCDRLTGLENRLFFQQRLDRDQKKEISSCSALLLLGLDNFTEVNERLGHQVANDILRQVADNLEKIAQRNHCWTARVGGDQFSLWVPRLADKDRLASIVGAIQSSLTSIQKIDDGAMGASVGVALSPVGEIVDGLFHRAEAALQRAKYHKRGSVEYFSSSYEDEVNQRRQLEQELMIAFDEGQICAHYQPIINYKDLSCAGIEALVRWQHPVRGLLAPYEFLGLVTELGLMSRLGEIVLRQSCELMSGLRQEGIAVGWVSVNLSAEQLHNSSLVACIEGLLKEFDLPGSCLELEIVEEQIAYESALVQSLLSSLSDLGIGLSIDDFGTGHSSLSRLKHLPVKKLKIDKSFVDGLPNLEEDQCIASAIIGLAKGLGLMLVAEGVETREQALWLNEQGCEYLQGYYFSRPIGVDALKSYLSGAVKGMLE